MSTGWWFATYSQVFVALLAGWPVLVAAESGEWAPALTAILVAEVAVGAATLVYFAGAAVEFAGDRVLVSGPLRRHRIYHAKDILEAGIAHSSGQIGWWWVLPYRRRLALRTSTGLHRLKVTALATEGELLMFLRKLEDGDVPISTPALRVAEGGLPASSHHDIR